MESRTHRQDCHSEKQGWACRPHTLPGARGRRLDSELRRAPAVVSIRAPQRGGGALPSVLHTLGRPPGASRSPGVWSFPGRHIGVRSGWAPDPESYSAGTETQPHRAPETRGSLGTCPARRYSPVWRRFWARGCREASELIPLKGVWASPTRRAWASPDRAAALASAPAGSSRRVLLPLPRKGGTMNFIRGRICLKLTQNKDKGSKL